MDVLAAVTPVTSTADQTAPSTGSNGAGGDFVATLQALLDAGTPAGELTVDPEISDAIAAMLDVEVDPDELATAGWPVSLIAAALKHADATAIADAAVEDAQGGAAGGVDDVGDVSDDAGAAAASRPADAMPAGGDDPVDPEPAGPAPAVMGVDAAVTAARPRDGDGLRGAGPAAARATDVATGRGVGAGHEPTGQGADRSAAGAVGLAAATAPAEAVPGGTAVGAAAPAAASVARPGADAPRVTQPADTARHTDGVRAADAAEQLVQVASAEAASGRSVGRAAMSGVQPLTSSAVQRVLDAVEQLELMPPPRQLVLELGDARVRVAMEEGQIRLTLLGERSAAGDELLSDARDQLAQRGFDLGGDGRREQRSDDQATPGAPAAAAATATRSDRTVPAGIRL